MSSDGLMLVFKVPESDMDVKIKAEANIFSEVYNRLPVGVTGSLLALFFLSLEGILQKKDK